MDHYSRFLTFQRMGSKNIFLQKLYTSAILMQFVPKTNTQNFFWVKKKNAALRGLKLLSYFEFTCKL